MAERRAEVVCVGGASVAVRALGTCSDCGGCGGRCNLFLGDTALDDAAGTLQLPPECFSEPPSAGQQVVLVLAEGWLARSALRGYGVPLFGLLAGGALGHAVALAAQWSPDPAALVGAALGTFASFTVSKGLEPQIAVRTMNSREST